MIGGDLDYALARIAACRARRAGAPTWQAIGAARGLAATLAALRGHGLSDWVEEISPDTDPRKLEHALREAWRCRLDTLSGWLPSRWRPALAQCRTWLDLPAQRASAASRPPASTPAPETVHAGGADADWEAGLACLLNTAGAMDDPGLLRLGHLLTAHRGLFAALPPGNGWPARAELERALLAFMHITPPGAATAFAWLALLALEHERVRGLLLAAALEDLAA